MYIHSSADHTPPIESMYVLRNRLPCQQFPSRLRRGLVQSASEPPGLLCVPHVPVSPCPHVPSRPLVAQGSAIQRHGLTPCSARHDLKADDRSPMTIKRMTNDPARIPNQARTMPNFSGFFLISRIARTPNHMANGAGKTKIESSPK